MILLYIHGIISDFFLFRSLSMLFAQTGTTTSLSLPPKTTQEEVNPALIALWWIVPLVIAAIWIALTVRAKQAQESRRQSLRKEEAAKPKGLSKGADSRTLPKEESFATELNEPETKVNNRPQSPPQAKSKKDKSKGNAKNKPNASPTVSTTNQASVPSDFSVDAIASSQAQNEPTSTTDAVVSTASATSAEPKPSNAIFEPLREASKARRKPTEIENAEDRSPRGESASRGNDAYNQLFGGKFERIIPKQTLRSSTNRWPASEATPTRIPPKVAESATAQEPTETAVPAPTTNAPAITPPAKGLKSFVSKVKNQPGPDSQ